MRRLAIDPQRPSAHAIAEAAAIIERGGLVAMPTDTLYGLAVDPFSSSAISRLFAVKGRGAERAVALVAADISQVVEHIGPLPPIVRRLALAYWPGPLTLLMPRPSLLPAELTGGSDRVGVRVPANVVAQELCRASRRELTATSANVSGQPATDDPEVVARVFADSDVDLLLDAGKTAGGPPSTIVDVVNGSLHLVRPGAIDWEEICQSARP